MDWFLYGNVLRRERVNDLHTNYDILCGYNMTPEDSKLEESCDTDDFSNLIK